MGRIDLSRLRIGNGVPSSYRRTECSTSDVIKSLTTFSEEHFRGILSLEVTAHESGQIMIAADGFAFFLKLLLYRVFGRAEVKATVECERYAMHITFYLCGVDIETAQLFEVAEHSGFTVECCGDAVIRLTTEVKRSNVLMVYAGDQDVLLRHLYAVFFCINE